MASRANSDIFDDDPFDPYSAESSPDPLSRSINENTPSFKRTPARSSKNPLKSTSPSKQNQGQSASFDIVSPSKSMVLNTPRGTGASPWRIKVTVQAEPEAGDENASSPIVQHVTRTQTTTVPLRDPDASSPVKRRGRPRKSDVSSARTKRNGTPVRKTPRPKSKTRDVATDSSSGDVETDTVPKKRRGRPRKSQMLSEEQTLDALSQELSFTGASVREESASPKKKRGRPRKSIQPTIPSDETSAEPEAERSTPEVPAQVEIPVIETTVPTPQSRHEQRTQKLADNELVEKTRFTPPQTDLSKSIRQRKSTPAAKEVVVEISSDEGSDINTPSDSDEDAPMINALEEPSVSRHAPAEDLAPMEAPEFEDVDDDEELEDATGFAFEEGATRGPEDTTIVESENFSMISVHSLPSIGTIGRTPITTETSIQNHEYLTIPSAATQSLNPSTALQAPAVRPTLSRHITPVMDQTMPSNPPPIEAPRPSPYEAQTPQIGRVVKAGVALQGVLDPTRATPEAGPSKAAERRSELDDLFRGFSDRTRKELRDGLRLGEQLARENASNKGSPAVSSPIKETRSTNLNVPQTKEQQSRLLTPEENEQETPVLPADDASQGTNVQYPTLNTATSHLPTPSISPVRSEDEMSWKVDTPPVNAITVVNNRSLTVRNEHGEILRGKDILVETEEDVEMNDDDQEDMWADEAVQSANAPRSDAITQDEPLRPARAKLPRTWRRKSANNFNYSDESEEATQPAPPMPQSSKKATLVEVEEGSSDVSDNTGVYFQKDYPAKKNIRGAEKLDLSLLMNEGGSLLPDSSPPAPVSKSASAHKPNPFLEAPRFAVYSSSPVRSSPLRHEIRGSHSPAAFEESTLPLAPSSPFRTIVDEDVEQSDQRQIYDEIEDNQTDTSLRNIRTEANGYVDAYDMRDRTLGDITEVTEPSRSFIKRKSSMRSSPQKKTFEESMVKSKQDYAPVFDDATSTQSEYLERAPKKQRTPESARKRVAVASATEEPAQPSTGILSRIGSSLWGAFGSTTPAPLPLHPILAKIDHLPKVEPWTKTHYKTLDKLYQKHIKNPSLLSPHHSSPSSALNIKLRDDFLNKTDLPFVGATFSVWGYSITFDDGLVVLCAVYMQLLSLADIDEYEAKSGKAIQMGDCAPREDGIVIEGEEVAQRLATVIIGDELRRDEKKGRRIRRQGSLQVEWPEA